MTDKNAFTPGPWAQDGTVPFRYLVALEDGALVRGSDGRWAAIAVTDGCDYSKRSDENRDANARLVAAAPSLYEALDRLLNCIDGQHDPDWLNRCKEGAKAALAQASATR